MKTVRELHELTRIMRGGITGYAGYFRSLRRKLQAMARRLFYEDSPRIMTAKCKIAAVKALCWTRVYTAIILLQAGKADTRIKGHDGNSGAP
jgi:hypothetical protein